MKRTLRRELLHNIDPFYLQGRIKDSDYVNGVLQTPATFDTSIHAALRVGDMKIMTGEQGINIYIIINIFVFAQVDSLTKLVKMFYICRSKSYPHSYICFSKDLKFSILMIFLNVSGNSRIVAVELKMFL